MGEDYPIPGRDHLGADLAWPCQAKAGVRPLPFLDNPDLNLRYWHTVEAGKVGLGREHYRRHLGPDRCRAVTVVTVVTGASAGQDAGCNQKACDGAGCKTCLQMRAPKPT